MAPPPETIATARLLLRPPTNGDAEAIYTEYAQDPVVTRYLSWKPHRRVETVEAFLRESLSAQDKGNRWLWAITVKGSDWPVGMIDTRLHDHRFNSGYVLAKRLWGKGYMPEALQPIIDWALEQDHIYRAWAFCDVDNRASARVLEKVGMQKEGTLRRWFVHPNVSDVPRDCFAYSRVKG
jgi:[ribosomal protein S5]-alanine N-acetyltransferase